MGTGLAFTGMGMALGMVLMLLGQQAWKDYRERMRKQRAEYLSRQVMTDDTLVFYNKTLPSTVYRSKGRHVHRGEVAEVVNDVRVWTQTQIEVVWVTVKREVPKVVHTVRERVEFYFNELQEWWEIQGPDRSEGLTEEVLAQLRGDTPIMASEVFEDVPVVPIVRKRPAAIALPAGRWTWPRVPHITLERNRIQHGNSLLRVPMYVTPPRALSATTH